MSGAVPPPPDPRYSDPRYPDPRFQDPRFQDQRYAHRAQRDAWKVQQRAQRDAYQAQRQYLRGFRRPSLAGPIVLVTIGIVFLLLQTGRINRFEFWMWYGRWWPLLLIGIGLITLLEWFLDRSNPYPTRRSIGGIVVLLIVLSSLGGITNTMHNFGPIRDQFGDSADGFSFMQGPEHTNDDRSVTELPDHASVQIQIPRGDVVISASSDSRMHIEAHEVAHASSDGEAGRLFASLAPKVTVSGSSVTVRVPGASNGVSNLSIELPPDASTSINAGRGDVTVSGLQGSANIVSGHGDVKLDNLSGSAQTRMTKGDFSGHAIHGDLTVEGRGEDVTLSGCHGKVLLDGDFFGDIHLQQITAPVHFHSSHIDIELARVDGDMTLDKDDLNMQQVVGPSKIVARSKEIEGSQMSGDIHLENMNGDVTVSSINPMGNIQIVNQKGAINFSAPVNANFSVEAQSSDGEIDTDFPLSVTGSEMSHAVSGQVGRGGPRVTLTANHGDIHLKRGDESTAVSSLPAALEGIGPLERKQPHGPMRPMRHLKASPEADEQTTVQQ